MATHKKPGFKKGTTKTVTITHFVIPGIVPGNIVMSDIFVNVILDHFILLIGTLAAFPLSLEIVR